MHPSTQQVLKFFEYAHLPEHLRYPARFCAELALELAANLPESPEVTVGLRKLLEAKDCFVRALL